MHTHSNYIFEYLESDLNVNLIKSEKVDQIIQIKITSIEKASSILLSKTHSVNINDVTIKNYNEKDELKKESILCSKVYYFDQSYEKIFEWWIEMNKLNGYDKLVIFNNSLPFRDLFRKYEGFVEVVQFQCLPNFFSSNMTKKDFIKFSEIETIYKNNPLGLHMHFEYLTFNECYLLNKDKYKYVAIMDQDESIIPRTPFLYNKSKPFQWSQLNKTDIHVPSFESYFQTLRKAFGLKKKVTFSFRMAVYLKQKTMHLIFNELSNFFKNFNVSSTTIYNYTISIRDPNEKNKFGQKLDFKFSIRDKQDLENAMYLKDLHVNYVEPFLIRNNKSLNLVPEPFNRLYMLMGLNSTMFLWGKTIHDSLQTKSVSTHYPNQRYSDYFYVPLVYGHLSHFRKDYNIYWGEFPLKEFYFDNNYFIRYYLPILRKLNYKIKI